MAQHYTQLRSQDNESAGDNDSHCRESSWREDSRPRQWLLSWRSVMMFKDVILLCLAIPGLLAMFNAGSVRVGDAMVTQSHQQASQAQYPDREPTRKSCKCGDTVAEAIENKCRFDSMALAWLPDHCRDDELTREFDRSGDGPNGEWTYWRDREGTKEISTEEISQNAGNETFRVYMTSEWHVAHCLFYWRREHQFKVNGKTLDPRFDTENHIKHCIYTIRDSRWQGAEASLTTNADLP
ncbi:hypothetical protein F4677DRAFT_424524 [Hypoxylon crocopeplum]|nr:hypothetical protein F4677DRAFT_424524 [Hypoxylon crocopeplum]